jgi:2-isopropylmalate synthase
MTVSDAGNARTAPTPPHVPAWNTQSPSGMRFSRYRPAHERVTVELDQRAWPSRRIERAPLWVPVDLRDGNQALVEPMDTARKLQMFRLLVGMGFKEIEVGYPSASSLEFDFVRHLIAAGEIPDDVTIVVFTPARGELIDRTFESIVDLDRAIVHMYTAVPPIWREIVLRRSRQELKELIVDGARHILRAADQMPGTYTRFQFSPEVFNLSELEFSLEVCNAVTKVWDASPDRPVIHNLPATIEIATPNVYADQIEWMHRNLDRRESVILSVHTHNDRGTGVASTELAIMAGAERVEGCLFGNGERTGNVDLITLALNLFTQGIDPMIDLSDIDSIRRTVEHCNRLPVHDRHPYAGALTHTAFSGTHQDAIRKGMTHHRQQAARLGVNVSDAPWDVPYLPIDPADIGRSYDAIVRVNSQSGKGGVAYLLESEHGLNIPRRLQVDFARVAQLASEVGASGGEVTSDELWTLFEDAYLRDLPSLTIKDWEVDDGSETGHRFTATMSQEDQQRQIRGVGNGPLDAFVDALDQLDIDVEILEFHEHARGHGSGTDAVAYIEAKCEGTTHWGVGIDSSIVGASVIALSRAIAR